MFFLNALGYMRISTVQFLYFDDGPGPGVGWDGPNHYYQCHFV